MKRLVAVFLIIFPLFFVLTSAHKGLDVNAQTDNSNSDRVIVKFRHITPKFFRNKILQSNDAAVSEELRAPDTLVIKVPSDKAANLVAALSKNFLVEYAEQDYIAYALDTPNDSLYGQQWGLAKIDAPGAWSTTHGADSVDIAIIDTGINSSHPDLAGKIVASVNCTSSSSCPNYTTSDPYGHGTHVAGISSAITNNGQGIAGVSWEARLMSVKVLSDYGSGYYSWISNGVYWATDNGAEVINMSLGSSYGSRTLENAINYAVNRGVLVVAAAGNSGWSYASYPAYYSNVMAVAATDENDAKASFSNYGSWVDVAAPGTSILSTYHNDYRELSGTSMASPHVAGLAALIISQHPGWSPAQVRSQIEQTADVTPGTGSYYKYGRVNACNAVGCGLGVTPTPTVEPTNIPTPTNTPVPTQTPTPTVEPTPVPTDVPTPIPTETPVPTVEPSPTQIPSPTPTPQAELPWWCKYVPWHYTCQL